MKKIVSNNKKTIEKLKGKILFPKKLAEAKEIFKNVKLPTALK